MTNKTYYHFLANNRRLRYGDNRVVVLGEWVFAEGPIEMCMNGMHACENVFDALLYSPGCLICKVELSDDAITEGKKTVASARKVVAWADITAELQEYARACALDVAHLWDMPDVVRLYLKTGDEKLRIKARKSANTERKISWGTFKDSAIWAAELAAKKDVRGVMWCVTKTTTKNSVLKQKFDDIIDGIEWETV